MDNKVLTNFRDHPSLRFNDPQSVFKIDDKVYLISEGVVRQIKPKSVQLTNIGEPYRNLVRLNYFFSAEAHLFDFTDVLNEQHQLCIDFAPEDEEALRQLLDQPTTLIESLNKAGLLD
jgi:Mg2+ and Co2+ transporter CorA